MRVGLVIYGSLDTVSGGYLYDRVLVNHLRQSGDEVEIISLPWRNYAAHLTDNLLLPVIRHLRAAPLEVLLQDELNHPSLFFLNRFIRGRYPLISIVHHLRLSEQRPAWQNLFYRQIERAYLNSVDGFIFNSETTQTMVLSTIKAVRTKPLHSVVAYPGGNRFPATLTPDQIQTRAVQTPFRILFVGNLIPRKGLHILLEALARVNGDWELAIVGNPNVDHRYTEAIRRQLTPRTKLLGPLSEAELAAQLAASHVLVVPSSYEGFGIVYLEGMGFGLPAIASTAGAAHEIITHNENGFLINPGDGATLAQHLQALILDRDLLQRMSFQALERFQNHPTWTGSAERIRQFLLDMMRT